MNHPTRYVRLDAARHRHGARVDELGAWLRVGDPPADAAVAALAQLPHAARTALVDATLRARPPAPGLPAPGLPRPAPPSHPTALPHPTTPVHPTTPAHPAPPSLPQSAPPALLALVASMRTLPPWADRARMARGAATIVRAGLPAALVLGCSSIVLGFCSPGGNKALVFTGRLEGSAQRRLAETSRFVFDLVVPGGALPGGEGWIAAAKVRLMHAGVRRALLASPKWRVDDWGVPVNAFDSAGTVLLFSLLVADGLAGLGFPLTPAERGDLLHLWRYVGHVMGVPEPLHVADEAGARAFWDLIVATQPPPDEDARRLVHATLDGGLVPRGTTIATRARARVVRGAAWATSRRLLDPALVADLEFPAPDGWDRLLHLLYPVNRALSRIRSERLDRHRYAAGARYWERIVRDGLAGVPANFAIPRRDGAVPARSWGAPSLARRGSVPTVGYPLSDTPDPR